MTGNTYACGWCGRKGWDPTTLWLDSSGRYHLLKIEAMFSSPPGHEPAPVCICYDCGMQVFPS